MEVLFLLTGIIIVIGLFTMLFASISFDFFYEKGKQETSDKILNIGTAMLGCGLISLLILSISFELYNADINQ